MSIDTEMPRLNLTGQLALGGCSSILVNAVVHPLCTLKNRQMASAMQWHQIPLKGLYNGFLSSFAIDTAALGVAYLTNDVFQEKLSPFTASIAAGILSTPVIAFGEGLMANRQVNSLSYASVLKRALRPAGLTTTVLREVPFCSAVFYFTPKFNGKIEQLTQSPLSLFAQAAIGASVGAFAGYGTTPIDLIKTRVQVSPDPISIVKATKEALTEQGVPGLFRGGSTRAVYIALTTALITISMKEIPPRLPKALSTTV